MSDRTVAIIAGIIAVVTVTLFLLDQFGYTGVLQ